MYNEGGQFSKGGDSVAYVAPCGRSFPEIYARLSHFLECAKCKEEVAKREAEREEVQAKKDEVEFPRPVSAMADLD